MIKLLSFPIAILLVAVFFFLKDLVSMIVVSASLLFLVLIFLMELMARRSLFEGSTVVSKAPRTEYDEEEIKLLKKYPLYVKGTWISREVSASITVFQIAMLIIAIADLFSSRYILGGSIIVLLLFINPVRVRLDPGIFLRNSQSHEDKITDCILTRAYNKFWGIQGDTPIFQTLNKY